MANRHQELVAARAGDRCEYCHLPRIYAQLDFVCDHIIAIKHEGPDAPENLAYSCPHCNSYKLDNIAGIDYSFDEPVRLFNPRRDIWLEHFRWDSAMLVGLTSIGRVTIKVLRINEKDRLHARRSLLEEGISLR